MEYSPEAQRAAVAAVANSAVKQLLELLETSLQIADTLYTENAELRAQLEAKDE